MHIVLHGNCKMVRSQRGWRSTTRATELTRIALEEMSAFTEDASTQLILSL